MPLLVMTPSLLNWPPEGQSRQKYRSTANTPRTDFACRISHRCPSAIDGIAAPSRYRLHPRSENLTNPYEAKSSGRFNVLSGDKPTESKPCRACQAVQKNHNGKFDRIGRIRSWLTHVRHTIRRSRKLLCTSDAGNTGDAIQQSLLIVVHTLDLHLHRASRLAGDQQAHTPEYRQCRFFKYHSSPSTPPHPHSAPGHKPSRQSASDR